MEHQEFEEELLQEMLNWLGRGMNANGQFPEDEGKPAFPLSEQDRQFLRSQGIVPLD